MPVSSGAFIRTSTLGLQFGMSNLMLIGLVFMLSGLAFKISLVPFLNFGNGFPLAL